MSLSIVLSGVAMVLLSISNLMQSKDIRDLKLEQQRLQMQVQQLEKELPQ